MMPAIWRSRSSGQPRERQRMYFILFGSCDLSLTVYFLEKYNVPGNL
jgi:hypothetical protein